MDYLFDFRPIGFNGECGLRIYCSVRNDAFLGSCVPILEWMIGMLCANARFKHRDLRTVCECSEPGTLDADGIQCANYKIFCVDFLG
jgi:hypothetical protein